MNQIPPPVQCLADALQRSNYKIEIKTAQAPGYQNFYKLCITRPKSLIIYLAALFQEIDGLKIHDVTAFPDRVIIVVGCKQAGEVLPEKATLTITAEQYDAGYPLEKVTAIDFGPATDASIRDFFTR